MKLLALFVFLKSFLICPAERDNLFEMVEVEWEMRKERRDKRLAASAESPDHPEAEAQQDDEDEDDEEEEDDEEDECIVKVCIISK